MILSIHQDFIWHLEVTDNVVVLIGIYIYYYYDSGHSRLSRASTKHTSGAEQKCTTREVIGQRKCPRQLFGRSVTEAGWQQAGRVSE